MERAVVLAARRLLSTDRLAKTIAWLDQTAHLCTPSIAELVQKPPSEEIEESSFGSHLDAENMLRSDLNLAGYRVNASQSR